MKILFVPSENRVSVSKEVIRSLANKLPKKIGLISTIQFNHLLDSFKSILSLENKTILINNKGIILGCDVSSALNIQDKVDAFLYIGSGFFHPSQVALKLKTKKTVFLFNPLNEQFSELDYKEIEKIKSRQKTAKIRYLSSDKLGILVSIKPGQNQIYKALKIKEYLEKKGKEVYLFLMDNFDQNQLENWPDLAWINTSCPGISQDALFLNSDNL